MHCVCADQVSGAAVEVELAYHDITGEDYRRGAISNADNIAGWHASDHTSNGAHALDELGISTSLNARPVQAALASDASFAVGATLPLVVTAFARDQSLIAWVSGTSLVFLVMDNYGTHTHPNVQAWLMRHPRFVLHFVPTRSSWLNLVERWFGELTRKRIRPRLIRQRRRPAPGH